TMLREDVIALVLGVHRDLPVGPFVHLVHTLQPKLVETLRGEPLRDAAEILGEGLLRVEIDEDEAVENLGGDRGQTELALIEVKEVLGIGNPFELAGRVIAPGVEIAGQIAAASARYVPGQSVAAMRADIVKSA